MTGPTPGPPGATPKSVVRSDAQAVLSAGKVLGTGGYSAGGPPLGAMAIMRHVQSRRQTQAVQCSSGGGSGVGSVSFSQSTDAQGNNTQVYTDYYDANCQQTERIATLTFPPGSSLSSGNITGTTTEEDHNGAVIGYATFNSQYNQNTMTVQTADAKTVGGAIVGRSGATCNVTSQTSQVCGLASFATVGGTTTGITVSINESFTQNGQNFNVTAQLTGTTYSGSGLTLVPPSSGTAWGLSGGTQGDAISGTGNATYSGSIATSGNYSVTDSTAGITASGSIAGQSLTLTINLTQGSTTLATIVIDADGNGTITYTSDSSRENVAGFTIFG